MASLRRALHMSDVVDDNGNWSGKINYFLQTGDLIDKGVNTIVIYRYMETLRAQAEAAGGVVVSLLGNHEYMNIVPSPNLEVWPEEIATFGSEKIRWKELTVGSIGTSWCGHYKVACRLPLQPSVGPLNEDYNGDKSSPLSHAAISFVHGGLPPAYPHLTPLPSQINGIGLSALKKLQLNRDSPTVNVELRPEEHELARFAAGPVWYRGWAQNLDEAAVCKEVEQVLQRTGTRRMVMAHTPQLDMKGILSRCGGKIIVIDTGITAYYRNDGGVHSTLSIEYTLTPNPEVAESADQQVWSEREVVTAMYDGYKPQTIVNYERVVTGNFAWDQ